MPALSTTSTLSTLHRNLAHGANDIYWFILPPVLPLILQEFGLRYTGVGGLVAAYLSVIAVSSIVMGRISDRVSRRHLVAIGFGVASLALWAASLSPGLTLVAVFLVIAGLGVSAFHPTAYAAIHETDGARGVSYGAFEASGALAVALMYLVHGSLVARVGWRGVLMVGAVPGAIMGLAVLWARTTTPSATRPPPGAGAASASPPRSLAVAVVLVFAVMLRFLGTTAVNNFLPTYLVRAAGMATGLASYAVGFAFLGSMAGALVSGRAVERLGPVAVFLASSALLVPATLALSLDLPVSVYPVLLVVFGFSVSACIPAQNVLLNLLTAGRGQGRVFGVLMGMTTVAASASPLIFGAVADGAGLGVALRWATAPAGAALVVAAAALLGGRIAVRPR